MHFWSWWATGRESPVEDLGGGREAAAIQSAYMLFADPLSQPHSLRQQVDCSRSLLPCIFHQLLQHLGLVCMIHSKMKGLLSAVSPHCYVRVNKNAPSFLSLLMVFCFWCCLYLFCTFPQIHPPQLLPQWPIIPSRRREAGTLENVSSAPTTVSGQIPVTNPYIGCFSLNKPSLV